MYGNGLYGQNNYGSEDSNDGNQDERYINLLDYLPEFYLGIKEMIELQLTLGYEVGDASYTLKDILEQFFIQTSTWGLDRWEKVFGIATDKSRSYEYRREVILAKLRGFGTTTKDMIKNVAIAFSGGEVEIQEHPSEYRFVIQFVGVKGIPQNMSGLISAIDDIKPAHLAYSFKYTYTSWDNLKTMLWGTLKQRTWSELKIYEGDDSA